MSLRSTTCRMDVAILFPPDIWSSAILAIGNRSIASLSTIRLLPSAISLPRLWWGNPPPNRGLYYRNNVANTITLLDAMLAAGVKHLVFPSTCAVYGEPTLRPIPEVHPLSPISPYGATKLMVERILQDYGKAYGLQSITLRFFNAAGADPDGELGEAHEPETHLIPIAIQTALGQRPYIQINGTDYDTEDGTCIRDYVHVMDLANAFRLALEYLQQENCSQTVNLGNMRGFSVKEVIEMVERVSQTTFDVRLGPRRLGDPPVLVGSSDLANSLLGWKPHYRQLETIVRHAWQWHSRQSGVAVPQMAQSYP